MPLSVSQAHAVLRACVVQALQDSGALMQDLCNAARQALAQEDAIAYSVQQRQLAGQALQTLQNHQVDLVQAFPERLLEVLGQDSGRAGAAPSGASSASQNLSHHDLSLMDDAQVLAQVEFSRAKLSAAHRAEVPLAALNALVSGALRQPGVQPLSNPLRPDNYIRALQQVVDQTGVESGLRLRWMQHMREALGLVLVSTYERAAQYLRQNGVLPVGYAVVEEPPSGWRNTAVPWTQSMTAMLPGNTNAKPEAAAPAAQALLTVEGLRQLLAANLLTQAKSNNGNNGFGNGTTNGVNNGVANGVVSRAHSAPVAIDFMAVGAAQELAAPSLAAVPPQPQQLLRRMFEHLEQDQRLLPAMLRALRSLEPVLQQLLLHDSSFLQQADHPARKLLDQMAERSLSFRSEQQPGFERFIKLVHEVVGHLLQLDVRDGQPFVRVQRAWDKAWQQLLEKWIAPDAQQAPSVAVLDPQTALQQSLAQEMRQVPGWNLAPDWVQAFLQTTWAQVLAQSPSGAAYGLTDERERYQALLPALLRCTQEAALRADPVRCGALLAQLQEQLRLGLERIGSSAEQSAPMLEYLARQQTLALGYAAADMDADEALAQPWASASAPLIAPPLVAPALVAPGLAAPPLAEPELAPAATASAASTVPVVATAPTAPARPALGASSHWQIPLGQWVQIGSGQQALQSQLTWASPNGMLFLFTAADGSTQSMTRRMVDKLMAEGGFLLL